jgi:hypothetical protein
MWMGLLAGCGFIYVFAAAAAAAGKGVIKGADFANSLVTAADIKVVESYLDKVCHSVHVVKSTLRQRGSTSCTASLSKVVLSGKASVKHQPIVPYAFKD